MGRRTLIKAGAHTAWVVPAVQLVGAAPAMAVSGCQDDIEVIADWTYGTLTLQITNKGTEPLYYLTVTVGFNIGNPKYVSHSPKSWKMKQGKKSFSFSNGTLGPHATTTLTVTFSNYAKGQPGQASGDASGTVTGGSACPAPYSVKTRN